LIFDKDTDDDGVCDDTTYYYCQQANYNVVALTNSSGTVVEKIEYDPYGEWSFVLDGSTDNPYLFQGRRWDDEADLYYFRNRSYSPLLGRFMQRDPIGYADGMNLYEFVGGAPVLGLDPLGLNGGISLEDCLNSLQKGINSAKHLIEKHMIGNRPRKYTEETGKHPQERRERCWSMRRALDHMIKDCLPECEDVLLSIKIQVEALRRIYHQFCHDTPPTEEGEPFFGFDPLEKVANEPVQEKIKEWGWPQSAPSSSPSLPWWARGPDWLMEPLLAVGVATGCVVGGGALLGGLSPGGPQAVPVPATGPPMVPVPQQL